MALCRALVKQPQVLLADEPTGNLDRASSQIVWSALRSLAHDEQATVIVATHDERLAESADVVLTMGAQ